MAGLDIPPPSAQENDLLELQAQALRRSNLSLRELKPFTLGNLGLQYDANGVLQRMPFSETQDPFLTNFKEVQKQRLLGTYKSPQMEEGLLRAKFNLPSNLNSTIGRQSAEEYVKNAGILREGINRGGLESGANLISQREGLLSNLKARNAESFGNMNAADMKLLSGIQGALSPYQVAREQAMGSRMNDENIRSQRRAQNMQLAGTAVAVIATVAVAL